MVKKQVKKPIKKTSKSIKPFNYREAILGASTLILSLLTLKNALIKESIKKDSLKKYSNNKENLSKIVKSFNDELVKVKNITLEGENTELEQCRLEFKRLGNVYRKDVKYYQDKIKELENILKSQNYDISDYENIKSQLNQCNNQFYQDQDIIKRLTLQIEECNKQVIKDQEQIKILTKN